MTLLAGCARPGAPIVGNSVAMSGVAAEPAGDAVHVAAAIAPRPQTLGVAGETAAAGALKSTLGGDAATAGGDRAPTPVAGSGSVVASTSPRDKIKHVVIVMQENRSFDNYFGVYPGADGIPMTDGAPTVCNPDPATATCVKPYHNPNVVEEGGPHGAAAARDAINGGKMDGFVRQQEEGRIGACKLPGSPVPCLRKGSPDVMGYHDAREIPNYWTYAREFVLQDHFFAPSASYTLPSHLYLVSGWSARCQNADPASCTSEINNVEGLRLGQNGAEPAAQPYAWTDLTYLLHRAGVSWAYYVGEGAAPECQGDGMYCPPNPQEAPYNTFVSPLPRFQTVHDDKQVQNVQSIDRFFEAAEKGELPAVSWVVPDEKHSEHPPESIRDGQAYVTELVNAVMRSKDWDSTAIFITYDEWGGFYDHVQPPRVDQAGYGLRIPGLVISPYAKRGYVDHQVLSTDAYLRFIEDVFLAGQRLDPRNDGRPDPRPTVRENVPGLGNLMSDFDFAQTPRKPLILDPNAPPGKPWTDPTWRTPVACAPPARLPAVVDGLAPVAVLPPGCPRS